MHRTPICVFFILLLLSPLTQAVWHLETVDSQGDVGWYCSLAIDSQDNLHVSYQDQTNQSLKYAHWNGTRWSIQTVDADRCGAYTSLVLDPQGKPHIAYDGRGLRYAVWDGHTWTLTQINRDNVQFSTSLALLSKQSAVIAYNSRQRLKMARLQGTRWTTENIPATRSPMDCSLAADQRQGLHVAYVVNQDDDVLYTVWNGKKWTNQDPPTTSVIDGYWPSLKLDRSGQPHISFWESNVNRSRSGSLKYYFRNNRNWELQTVDADGDTGWFSSLALDSDNRAHISFHDHSRWFLKYASNAKGAWKTELVDSSGTAGYSSSIALNTRNRPSIAYYDMGQHQLMLAQWREGTNTLQGTVQTPSGAPAANVRVSLRSQTLNANTRTDQAGRYQFTAVPSGRYVVVPAQTKLAFVPDQSYMTLDYLNNQTVDFKTQR